MTEAKQQASAVDRTIAWGATVLLLAAVLTAVAAVLLAPTVVVGVGVAKILICLFAGLYAMDAALDGWLDRGR